MLIQTILVTPFEQNARILIDKSSRVACVVDPGGEIETLLGVIRANNLSVESVFLTHAHIDHAGGVMRLLAELERSKNPSAPVPLIAHRAEQELRQNISLQASYFGLAPDEYQDVREPDMYLEDGAEFCVGSLVGKALFTPGHSPGHLALYFAAGEWSEVRHARDGRLEKLSGKSPVVIAGDTLFASSIGRTDLPGGSHETLLRSIKEKLLTLPAETVVMPGHGPNTTIGHEKKSNPFLLAAG